MKKIPWLLFAGLCTVVGLYPSVYFLIDRKFGLLSSKSEILLADVFWNLGFYTHIIIGGIALLVGWSQFSKEWRLHRPGLHRRIGKVYVASALLSGVAGIFIGFNATGGIVAKTGFIALGLVWFGTTLKAFLDIRQGDINSHQKMMIFSFAACFAAVTLRLWLPLLIVAHHGEFEPAYRIVAWLCWVPNMGVAAVMVRRLAIRQPSRLDGFSL
ncbi:MAG: DUF2306 domain-containing protein [Saprospiraceae bacterium]